MEPFLPDWLKILLLAVIALIFAANLLGRARPNMTWLEQFRLGHIEISREERARRQRRGNRITGLEMILAGIAVPLVYGFSTITLFSEIDPLIASLVGACSLALVALGIWVLWRNR